MRDRHLFEYAVIRLVPSVEREEFLNAGVVVYCPAREFLEAAFELNESRLRAFAPDLNLAEIEGHLRAIDRVCAGGADAGPIGRLSLGERFRWLTAPRSTIVQTSPVHTGLCEDAREMLTHLVARQVR